MSTITRRTLTAAAVLGVVTAWCGWQNRRNRRNKAAWDQAGELAASRRSRGD